MTTHSVDPSAVPRSGTKTSSLIDGNHHGCLCTPSCEMPCWQRVGITTTTCCTGCAPLAGPGTDLPRNLALERSLTYIAAAAAGSHGQRLTALAEERALPGPVLDALARDFVEESREEAADWRNYLCWQIRQLDETRRQDRAARAARAALMQTLGAVSVAYDQLMVAASLLATTTEAT